MSNPFQQPNHGSGNFAGQGNFPPGNYGQGNFGPPINYGAYGPPPPKNSGPNWLLIILGVVGGGGILLVLACCGGLAWLGSPPKASPQASQPFEVVTVPLPPFPDRGQSRQTLEPGVTREEVSFGARGGYYATPGHGGILWIYLPEGQHAPGSLPCILICGAGSTMLEGMSLTDRDADSEGDVPEHIPYAKAGFAVVAYELDGPGDNDMSPRAYDAFRKSRAGLVNARNALEYVLAKVPEVNSKQIYSAGHSSAGTMSLLFAEHEPRLAGCIAYAPCTDVPAFITAARALSFSHQGIADFVVQSSPNTHESRLNCPVFLFHAEDDGTVDVEPRWSELPARLPGCGRIARRTRCGK
ncbi:MAG: prolyl oligopeptidase family serine peptidase [Planctomycetales bacterium]|nr:prolyl oligopeptidase family serine peptidase [Planctomycetales bacterium]